VLLIAVATAPHAINRHGNEALAIRNCLDKNGPEMTFRQRDGSFLLFCRLPDNRLGMQIVDKAKEAPHNWIERTAFVKGDGAWNTIRVWLDRIGATRWTRPLP
jgi:putative hemolysin